MPINVMLDRLHKMKNNVEIICVIRNNLYYVNNFSHFSTPVLIRNNNNFYTIKVA